MPIVIEHISYIYGKDTPMETKALDDVSLEIKDGEFLGLIGHTGSGKSTLVQHLNGLLFPTSGRVEVDGIELSKKVPMRQVRQKVGLVFQYPEHQLFEETVYLDVAFGPKNLGLGPEEVAQRVKEAMEMVGLSYADYKDRSPFELSGGQMRRVALAGVLAMRPKILVLDEPTAGLDPRSRDEILEEVKQLHDKHGLTVVLVSHSMEDIAKMVDRLVVMQGGKVILEGPPRQVFENYAALKRAGLGIPQVTDLMRRLHQINPSIRTDILTVAEAKEGILRVLREGKRHA